MDLLENSIEGITVIKTDLTKKIVIDNHPKNYPVYKIRLDQLYYNDKNDRIATWMSEYKTGHNIVEIDISSKVDYNNIIHDFITNSNKDALKKTQTNIELVGQQEYGVVLNDGRIIDGNRRVTCLRNIEVKKNKTQYFETIILDHDFKNHAKQIKMLELMLQHGVDEKIDYSPADRLVGIYNDIIENELLTVKEYAKSVSQTDANIQIEVEKAKLMVEYLEFINAPKQFHLTRTMNLSDPLKDLYKILKKIKNEDKKEDFKNIIFAQLFVVPFGDMTRHIRKIGRVASNSKLLDEFVEEQMKIVEKVCDIIEEHSAVTNKEINEIKAKTEVTEIKEKFYRATEKLVSKADSHDSRNQPLKLAEKSLDILESIDTNIIKKLNSEQKDDISKELDSIDKILSGIRSELDV